MAEQVRADYDSPWKEAIEHMFVDFMAFFFDELCQAIDWTRPHEFLDKELEKITRDAEIGRRYADKLVKVWLKSGQCTWILIHIEVQSQTDPGFDERMYVYNFRIFERYHADAVSLAILTHERSSDIELTEGNQNNFGEFYRKVWGCETSFKFPLIKLQDYRSSWAELEQSNNLFAIVVMAHLKAVENKSNPQRLKESKLGLMKGLYQRGLNKEQILELYCFIDWLMALPDALERSFESELQKFEEERQMPYVTEIERRGIEQGIEKGIEKEKIDIVINAHMAGVLPNMISKITGLKISKIQKIIEEKESKSGS